MSAQDAVGALLPQVRVVRGAPDEEEVAALVAGLVAAQGARRGNEGASGGHRPPSGGWGDRAREVGVAPRPGPGAWERSSRVR